MKSHRIVLLAIGGLCVLGVPSVWGNEYDGVESSVVADPSSSSDTIGGEGGSATSPTQAVEEGKSADDEKVKNVITDASKSTATSQEEPPTTEGEASNKDNPWENTTTLVALAAAVFSLLGMFLTLICSSGSSWKKQSQENLEKVLGALGEQTRTLSGSDAQVQERLAALEKKQAQGMETLRRDVDGFARQIPDRVDRSSKDLWEKVAERFTQLGDRQSQKEGRLLTENEALRQAQAETAQREKALAQKEADFKVRMAGVENRERATDAKSADLDRRIAEARNAERALVVKEYETRIAALESRLGALADDAVQKTVSAQVESGRAAIVKEMEAKADARLRSLEAGLSAAQKSVSEADARCAAAVRDTEAKAVARIAALEAGLGAAQKQSADAAAALQRREGEFLAEKQALFQSRETAEEETRKASVACKAAQTEVEALRGRIYPVALQSNPAFAPLHAKLEEWAVKAPAAAHVVLASLRLFMERNLLPVDSWQIALQDISRGISMALKETGTSPADSIAELARWRDFLAGFSEEEAPFTLNFPAIGSKVDVSWMTAKNKAGSVSRIIAWAVYNEYGIRYNAEVE